MKRRRSERETRYCSTILVVNEVEYDCVMLDESTGGCRLRIDGEVDITVGAIVKVELMSMVVPAVVRHVDSNRRGCMIGIEFKFGGARENVDIEMDADQIR